MSANYCFARQLLLCLQLLKLSFSPYHFLTQGLAALLKGSGGGKGTRRRRLPGNEFPWLYKSEFHLACRQLNAGVSCHALPLGISRFVPCHQLLHVLQLARTAIDGLVLKKHRQNHRFSWWQCRFCCCGWKPIDVVGIARLFVLFLCVFIWILTSCCIRPISRGCCQLLPVSADLLSRVANTTGGNGVIPWHDMDGAPYAPGG